ncbi:MAG: ABC transporter permease subunit, partial [Planctomycetia bacterium]
GKETKTVAAGTVVGYDPAAMKEPPRWLKTTGLADSIYLIWTDGAARRFDVRDVAKPALAETLDLVPEEGATATAVQFLAGFESLMVGDSAGRVGVWFRTKPDGAATPDGAVVVRGHLLSSADATAAITSLGTGARNRLALVGDAGGGARMFQVTTGALLAEGMTSADKPTAAVAPAAKDAGMVALGADAVVRWKIELGHPEATAATFFTPVHYEGYEKPGHVWQSSSSTDAFEPKLGLWPLIFGTLKATLYSMLFGAPLALLAAVYTSEFMDPETKGRVKPVIEMMASLPSVVLGFLAAVVIAPAAEVVVPAILAGFIAVPLAFLTGAYLWQLLPYRTTILWSKYRLYGIAAMLPAGLFGSALLGPVLEWIFFAGDVKLWLDGQRGTGVGAWFFMLLPLSALATSLLFTQVVNPSLRGRSREWSRPTHARVEFVKFLGGVAFALGAALLVGFLLNAVGFDPRGIHSPFDTYVQRNALVVGAAMGFAVIPIIYTLAEDALSTVPDHLRSASLGAGATQWQTAARIVVPTAMSGLFSAVMIGLGRAVGETMIVLMAAGNTPVMQWNMFNGFRTLSANLATELPEAVRNSTHYRTLFFAALVLFLMTFVLNTLAELVRIRFRKRAVQL